MKMVRHPNTVQLINSFYERTKSEVPSPPLPSPLPSPLPLLPSPSLCSFSFHFSYFLFRFLICSLLEEFSSKGWPCPDSRQLGFFSLPPPIFSLHSPPFSSSSHAPSRCS